MKRVRTPAIQRPPQAVVLRIVVVVALAIAALLPATALRSTLASASSPQLATHPDLWGFTSTVGAIGDWGSVDVTSTNGLPSFATPPDIVDNSGQVLIAGMTTARHVLLIAGGSPVQANWKTTDLTEILGLSSTTSPVLTLDQAGEPVLLTRTADGHLEMTTNTVVGRSPWQILDVTKSSGAPTTTGIPSVVEDSAGTEIFTRTPQGHLFELTNVATVSGGFKAIDLTALAGAVTITSDPIATWDPFSGQHHVAATGANGTVVEYADDNASERFWSARIFTTPTPLIAPPSVVDIAGTTWIFAATANHDLIAIDGKVDLPAAQWTMSDLTVTATGGLGVIGTPLVAVANGHIDVIAESSFANFVAFDAQLTTPLPTWRAQEVFATTSFSPATREFSLGTIGASVMLLSAGVMHVASVGTGLYAVPLATTAKAIEDGWPVIGITGALGAAAAPYTGVANSGQDLLTGKAIAAATKPATWLSFWTVSGPSLTVNLSATSCALSCTSVGQATTVTGSTSGVVIRSLLGNVATAEWITPPVGAASDPSMVVAAIGCATSTMCTAVGSALDVAGHRLPIWIAIDATSAKARFGTVPSDAGSNSNAQLNALACSSSDQCIAVGSYADTVGRTRAMVALATAAIASSTTTVPAPQGSSTNPRMTLLGLACSSPTACVGVGSAVDQASRTRSVVAYLAGSSVTSVIFGTNPVGSAANPRATLNAVACSSLSCTAVGHFNRASNVTAAMSTTLGATGVGASVAIPAPTGSATNALASLNAIACPTTTCQAVGGYTNHLGSQVAMSVQILNGNPARSTIVNAPAGTAVRAGFTLNALSCTAVLTCRAVGDAIDAGGDTQGAVATWSGSTVPATGFAALPGDAAAANPSGAYYQAGLVAGQYVGTVLASYPEHGLNLQPNFVILDPEGYPDNHSGLDGPLGTVSTAKWAAMLQGWADGLHLENPGTHPGVYADQFEYQSYGLSHLALPAFLAVAWTVSTKVVGGKVVLSGTPTPPTRTASGPNIDGYISFNDFCPSEWPDHDAFLRQISMFNKAPWNGTYNTVQFIRPNDYCSPR
jgi:hypothetical protein